MDVGAILTAVFIVGVITLCQMSFCENHPLYRGVPQNSTQQTQPAIAKLASEWLDENNHGMDVRAVLTGFVMFVEQQQASVS